MAMNRFLSSSLGIVNAVLAVVIIGGGVLGGLREGALTGRELLSAVVGGLLGIVVATLLCGAVATFIEMRDTLREILEELRRRSN